MNKKYTFKFNFHSKLGKYLVFALPQSNGIQHIDKLLIRPKLINIIEEETWSNKMVVAKNYEVLIRFDARLLSVSLSIDPNLKTGSYGKEVTSQSKNLLQSDRFINGKDKKVIALAARVVGDEKKLHILVKKLYEFTLEYLTYGKPVDGLHPYKQALEEKVTDCGGFSTFLLSLLRSQNIPSRLVVGFLVKDSRIKSLLSKLHVSYSAFEDLSMHAWLEVLLPNAKWFPLDPSIDWRRRKGLTNRGGGYGNIPADRIITSFGEDFKIKIDKSTFTIDILQKPLYL